MTPRYRGEEKVKRVFGRRSLLVACLQGAALATLSGRLWQLQMYESSRFKPLSEANRLRQEGVASLRGRILDRQGRLLASNAEYFQVFILPDDRTRMRSTLQTIARVLELTTEDIDKVMVKAQGGPKNRPILIRSGLTFEQIAEIGLLIPTLPSLQTQTLLKRAYAYGPAACHVVGYVGSLQKRALDDDPLLRIPSVRIGKSGVELGMDADLRGEAGTQKFEVNARGRVMRTLEENAPSTGKDVMVTVDASVQERVLQRLNSEVQASIVGLDVRTGEIRVMVSVPTFDPNLMTMNFDEESWKQIVSDKHLPLLNRSIGGNYPPGSTFKMVTALAALQEGAVTQDEQMHCPGYFNLGRQVYHCWKHGGHGSVDLHDAIKKSCNVYFYTLADRIGVEKIAAMAKRLGLGQMYACGLLEQKPGLIPDPSWKQASMGQPWFRGETISTGIGQGYVSASPLQLAVMTARIATGRAVVPTIVRKPDFVLPETPLFPSLQLPQELLDPVRSGMIAVVNEPEGTGGKARVKDQKIVVAGKTGTSQVRKLGTSSADADDPDAWEDKDHALFVCYFPADAPRYSIAAVVEHGGKGGAAAAPIVRDVIQILLDEDPEMQTSSLEQIRR